MWYSVFNYFIALKRTVDITILSLFPEFVLNYANFSLIKRAVSLGLLKFSCLDLRLFGLGERRTVDDRPYGGGVGMVLRPDVLFEAISSWKKTHRKKKRRVILMCPTGKRFVQEDAVRLSSYEQILFVSGRYEGFDERIREFVDEEISIGDYVLMGGELPALVVSEALLRLVPGVLGKEESAVDESFSVPGVLEHAQYTKPEKWKVAGKVLEVPGVLLSGHHGEVAKFRKESSMQKSNKGTVG
jgi:tRNA (guanine37-N1)-methyltransferase